MWDKIDMNEETAEAELIRNGFLRLLEKLKKQRDDALQQAAQYKEMLAEIADRNREPPSLAEEIEKAGEERN